MNAEKRKAWNRALMRKAVSKITRKPYTTSVYDGKKILDIDEANDVIAAAIDRGTPFMAGRFGSSELNAFWRVKDEGHGFDTDPSAALKEAVFHTGLFPEKEEILERFAREMHHATSLVDLMAVWFQPMEDYECRKWAKDPTYCYVRAIEPFFAEKPWTEKLAGKRVLVIHPFARTIVSQYERREKLFANPGVLPSFTLLMQPAVQTIAGNRDERFADWFEAYDYMFEEAMRQEFDVAVLGCGAYGFPLAARLKEAGKIAIHMGGTTQNLFGIRGRRWEERENYRSLMNEYWVHASEVPEGADWIEGGCYW